MSDSYVTSQAMIKCSCGDKCTKLTIYPDRTVFLTEKPMANTSDHVSMYNIVPFGKCHTTAYPPTGSATAANHGTLTPMPCVPGTVTEWLNGKDDYIIKGKPALLKSSYCKCKWGGIITIIDDGQVNTGCANLSKENKETDWKEKDQEKLLENKEILLEGIQMALDFAGFIPGVGAIADLTNAAIYVIRGDKVNAGLSLLAAIPGIGDVAAAAKIAGKGIKTAKFLNKNVKSKKAITTLTKEEKKIIAKKYVNKNVSNSDLLKEKGVTSDNVDEVYRQIKIERKREAINFYKEQWSAEKKTKKLIIKSSKEDFKEALVYDSKEFVKDTKEKRRAIINHINGIDFNYPVERVNISKGSVLYQYNSGKFGNYFTPDYKATPNQLGISSCANGKLREKFEIVFNDIPHDGLSALKSTAKSISDKWSTKLYSPYDINGKPSITIEEQTIGGGIQIFIPHNISNLDVTIRPLSIIMSN